MVFHRSVIKLASKFYNADVFCLKMPVCQSEICLNKDRLFNNFLNALTFQSPTPNQYFFITVFFNFKNSFFFTTVLEHIERNYKLIILKSSAKEQWKYFFKKKCDLYLMNISRLLIHECLLFEFVFPIENGNIVGWENIFLPILFIGVHWEIAVKPQIKCPICSCWPLSQGFQIRPVWEATLIFNSQRQQTSKKIASNKVLIQFKVQKEKKILLMLIFFRPSKIYSAPLMRYPIILRLKLKSPMTLQ